MNLYPWDDVVANAEKVMATGADIYQQFNCAHCGTKQTMEQPNKFYTSGLCEECGKETDIRKNGMNFMAHFQSDKGPRDTEGAPRK